MERFPVVVALLRGVNVGKHLIDMKDLRELCESLGLTRVETFIRSGNVVFAAERRSVRGLPKRFGEAIDKRFGFHCDVVLRTTAEMRDILARNPFAARPDLEPAKILITFLAADPDAEGCAKLAAMEIEPEEVRVDGREVFGYFPDLARPKLSWPLIAKCLQTSGTARNLTTVRKLLAMAERLESTL